MTETTEAVKQVLNSERYVPVCRLREEEDTGRLSTCLHVRLSADPCDAVCPSLPPDRLAGPVVKASAKRAEAPLFESRLRRHFSGSSHTSDLKTGYPARRLAL